MPENESMKVFEHMRRQRRQDAKTQSQRRKPFAETTPADGGMHRHTLLHSFHVPCVKTVRTQQRMAIQRKQYRTQTKQ